MQQRTGHRFLWAAAAGFVAAVIVAWALLGTERMQAVTAILILSATGLLRTWWFVGRIRRWWGRRNIKPEDRERRRAEREAQRRARDAAYSRYGIVVRGSPETGGRSGRR